MPGSKRKFPELSRSGRLYIVQVLFAHPHPFMAFLLLFPLSKLFSHSHSISDSLPGCLYLSLFLILTYLPFFFPSLLSSLSLLPSLLPSLPPLLPMFICSQSFLTCLSFLHPLFSPFLFVLSTWTSSHPPSLCHLVLTGIGGASPLLSCLYCWKSDDSLYYLPLLLLQASEQRGPIVSHFLQNCFRYHPWRLTFTRILSRGPG